VRERRLQKIQPVAKDHSNLGGHCPPAEVRYQREGAVCEPHLVLEIGSVRFPPQALGVAFMEEEAPDEAHSGRSNDLQGGGGVR
jgi:hypothetical protein